MKQTTKRYLRPSIQKGLECINVISVATIILGTLIVHMAPEYRLNQFVLSGQIWDVLFALGMVSLVATFILVKWGRK
jgi:NADH:ubiquinone oxidoreductase subunit H